MADIPVRLSHLLGYCSVGAVVRGPDCLVVVQDTRGWRCGPERDMLYVDHVRAALGLGDKTLRSPPTARIDDAARSEDSIPATRFPGWTRCPRCGLLHYRPWRRPSSGGRTRLRHADVWLCGVDGKGGACRGRLEQVPWVLVHERGYLADVPWHALAHLDPGHPGQRACRTDRERPYLRVEPRDRGHGVRCTSCQASAPLRHRFRFFPRMWRQPWCPEPSGRLDDASILEINDVRVHAPETDAALVIPPESRIRRGTVVDRLYGSADKQAELRSARAGLPRDAALRRIAREFRCPPDAVERALAEIDGGYPRGSASIPLGGPLPGEYRAFIEPIPDLREDEDFVTVHRTAAWSDLVGGLDGAAGRVAGAVDRLIAVDRLKEVLVFKGFRRLGAETVTPPDLTGETDWLPALELYGEGVFFTLAETRLRRWEADPALRARARTFDERLRGGPVRVSAAREVSPRFLLLHTLAHLLIRALETIAGYPAASLKERIYSRCVGDSGEAPMAGVLIYLAVPDAEGSLGGLVEQAEPRRFLRLLTRAVAAADWCSLDPVCGEREGHGPGLLNGAACHACALVPEPSCAYGNMLLDRTFVAGSVDGACPAPFGAWPPASAARDR